jgi:transcription antitermination factor NusA-like protein
MAHFGADGRIRSVVAVRQRQAKFAIDRPGETLRAFSWLTGRVTDVRGADAGALSVFDAQSSKYPKKHSLSGIDWLYVRCLCYFD